ncbi:TetR family transcriptional regulator [Shewanella sp. UCD-FRSSP16_17]|uniref:TetR/AcrR family transcriptional regulator n=1 Tax=Shewanella sp. UCD-FRSSP16_17 TaxID=1853256 RepID=UPI0007EE95DE|nr:TetR/AcrR family transcriptional regulator [Shewanella sp. UCD-FRSSP16_17]OBT03956.1 TetR family transcriptional regulator [Shewanella sp. UCD-FRSSP16_17]
MKDLKQKLLNVGFDLISEQGFAGLGLMKIINTAEATKGSFYHYFKSKEDFGTTLLTNYFEEHLETLDQYLMDTSLSYQDRVNAYFEHWCSEKLTANFQIKCLVVKLSGEVSGTSNQMQQVLNEGAETVIARMGHFFNEGVENKSFHMQDGYEAARTLYSLWLGSTLLAAIQKDRTLLDNAMKETIKLTK